MRQGLKWQITWARMPRLSKQYLPSLCNMCINEQGKTFKSVWDKGPVPSPQKKRKKKIRLYGNWRKWSLYMSSTRQGRADPGPREYAVRSVFFSKGFETETLFLTEWAIGEKKSGREGDKENTSCMSPLLTPTSQTQNQSHGGSVNDLKLPSETPVLKESFWCVCQRPFPPQKKTTEYFCLS